VGRNRSLYRELRALCAFVKLLKTVGRVAQLVEQQRERRRGTIVGERWFQLWRAVAAEAKSEQRPTRNRRNPKIRTRPSHAAEAGTALIPHADARSSKDCTQIASNTTSPSYSTKSKASWNCYLQANGNTALARQGRTFSKRKNWRCPAVVDQLS
jgi:hypothetical protein